MLRFSWQLEKRWGWLLFTSVLGLLSGGFCVFVSSVDVKAGCIWSSPGSSGGCFWTEAVSWMQDIRLMEMLFFINVRCRVDYAGHGVIFPLYRANFEFWPSCFHWTEPVPFWPIKEKQKSENWVSFQSSWDLPLLCLPAGNICVAFLPYETGKKILFLCVMKTLLDFPFFFFFWCVFYNFFLACKYFPFKLTNSTCFKICSGSAHPAEPCQACEKPNECAGSLILWWHVNSSGLNF